MKERNNLDGETIRKLTALAKECITLKRTLRIGTKSLTPLNYSEEMEKFFSSKKHNPQYIYKDAPLPPLLGKIDKLKSKFEKMELPKDLKDHFLEFLEDQKILFLTKQTIGKKGFSEHAHELFDWGSDRLDLLLTNTPKVEFKMHIKHKLQNADVIKSRFEEILQKYNITGFRVNIDSFSPHIINVGNYTINIGSQIRRFECNVDRLIVHEIESHVLQAANTKKASTPLGELTKYGNQNLYGEGLAVYNEIATRKITPSAYEMYYNRIKAVRNLNKSFREIFEILCEDLTPQRAFVMTYRVKRGLSDTSAPGGFPKDAAYLLGYHEIQNLVDEKFPRSLLYATRSPILSALLSKYGLLETKEIITPTFPKTY